MQENNNLCCSSPPLLHPIPLCTDPERQGAGQHRENTLDQAVVSLLAGQPLTLIRKTRAGNGAFRLSWPKQADSALLITTYTGYRSDTVWLTRRATDKPITILLKEQPQALQTVVIKSIVPPATVRNDTIAFNPSAYPVRPRATLEDLLRKLPGVEIELNGQLTSLFTQCPI